MNKRDIVGAARKIGERTAKLSRNCKGACNFVPGQTVPRQKNALCVALARNAICSKLGGFCLQVLAS